jgi:sigma-E factor negative regulatory protein RseB
MECPATQSLVRAGRGIALCLALGGLGPAMAQVAPTGAVGQQTGPGNTKPPELSVGEWLLRMHEASRSRSYIGTFVVSSNTGSLSSGRIWHACDGAQQVERVESLTGAPRSTFRRNEEVVTMLPESRVVRTERRDSPGLFPNLLKFTESSIPEFYAARRLGFDRVAGFDTDVVRLEPKDNLRFGYRIWSERKTGLVVKLQTLDSDGNVLEQTAFSELQLDAPVSIDKLNRMMAPPEGWRVERAAATRTEAAAEGWQLRANVPGFAPVSCYRRSVAGVAVSDGTLQWVFSDGLAAVSLFVESYDRQRHVHEGLFASGATQTLTRHIQDWWLTAVGEVPANTLKAFAQSLERRN